MASIGINRRAPSLRTEHVPPSATPEEILPRWVRGADVLTVLLGLAALQAALFGGFQIPGLSIRNPWRPLVMAVVLVGLRHYLFRAAPLYRRLWVWRRWVRWIDAVRNATSRWAAGLRAQRGWLEALHVTGLWSVAVAQPLFEVLSRSPEFLVAHDARPGSLIALVLVLVLAGPAACLIAIRLLRRLGPEGHALAVGLVIGALVGAISLAAVRQVTALGGGVSFGAAVASGALAAGGYVAFSTVRVFATFLSPAALVVPAAFLLQPTIAPFLSPPDADPFEGITFDETPPVVVVVFDQLPLASLLDREGRIDQTVYPNFASLADDATWFRNASAVAGLTNFALPAIVTGNYPSPDLLPTAEDHPRSLFTVFGSRYRLHVHEPLTNLCPETLCGRDRPGMGAWLVSALSDLSIVYLWTVLPETVAEARLPPVTQSWRDFANASEATFGGRWRLRRTQDRRAAVVDFIAEVASDIGSTRPTLHFLHVLLPHEPWLYSPSGQQLSRETRIIGGMGDGRWRNDARAIALNYQRHLLQAQYVDTILGRLMERLRGLGIYDDALVVVTSDHGLSLRPGFPSRTPTATTFVDIASVPLLVKLPGQQDARVVTTNVETIDILPTLAAELGIGLPWAMDGSNAFIEGDVHRSAKTMFIHRATGTQTGPGDLGPALAGAVGRKFAIFPTGDARDQPRLGVHDDLVGVRVADVPTGRPADFEVTIDSRALLGDVDHDSDFVPAHITGAIVAREPEGRIPPLAVAVNDVVAAVTGIHPFRVFGRDLAWEVVVDPRVLAQGANTLAVFAIRAAPNGSVVLDPVAAVDTPGAAINLLSTEAEVLLDATSSGFFSREWAANRFFRWTTDTARLSVSMDPERPPSTLTVEVLMTGPAKRLQVAVDGCRLFDETIRGRWTQTFALDGCRLDSPTLEIELAGDVHIPSASDTRALGVAVASIELGRGTE